MLAFNGKLCHELKDSVEVAAAAVALVATSQSPLSINRDREELIRGKECESARQHTVQRAKCRS